MIEGLAKGIEFLEKTAGEKSSFNPDMRLEKSGNIKDVLGEGLRKPSIYNPDFRIAKANEIKGATETKPKQAESYNPDEKVEKGDKIKCRNEELEGKKHPETGVPFERKKVKDADGNEVEGVFPVFESEFDAQLADDLLQASDSKQFAECNKQLKEAVEKDPELAKKFTPEQLEQIKNGDTPDGYTWHHNEEKGKMQLVDSETHAKTGHTGGKSVWGGGNENR